MLNETAMLASAAAISSSASRYVSVSRPSPPYSSGVTMPRKPSLPSSSITSRANRLVRSHSAANGSILARAKSRASSTIWRWTSERPGASSTVDMEPPAALAAQAARRDHRAQQRAGPVLVVAQVAVQHLEGRETDIEPDQVGERERTLRVIHPQLHHGVDRLRDRKSTRLNSSHSSISYAVLCLKQKKTI